MPLWKKILLWVVTALLGVLFTFAGLNKILPSPMAQQFAEWGYPVWFLYLIGGVEVACGIALFVPKIAARAALPLIVVMAGAAFTHVRAGEWPNPVFNLLFAAGLFWIHRERRRR